MVSGEDMVLSPVLSFPNGFHVKLIRKTWISYEPLRISPDTSTEQVFVPDHLSRLPLGPGQKVAFVPGPTASRASGRDMGLLSRLEAPTGIKGHPFVPVDVSNRDKTPWPPYPLPSPPARAIQLTCFLLFLARERGVLAHFFTRFVKIFDFPSIHRR